jgi:subtilase family serine protease
MFLMKHVGRTLFTTVAFSLLFAGCFGGGGSVDNTAVAPASNGGTALGCTPAQAANFVGPFLQTNASAGSLAKLTSHIPPLVKSFSDQGKMADDQQLPVTIALQLNNQSELFQKLNSMYRVGSDEYHQFLTPDQFRARYAPTADQVQQVAAFLSANGVQSLSLHENGVLLHGVASAKTIGSTFHTEIHQYKDSGNHAYFAPAYELQSPTGLPIQGVHGIQNVSHWYSHAQIQPSDETPDNGTGPNGSGFAPADIRKAYNIPAAVTGTGQTLALLELDGYTLSDITAYETQYTLSVPLQTVLVDGYSGAAGTGANEVTLDIELMMAVASGASRIRVYEAPNSSQSILDAYSKIANDNSASQISTSWGIYEGSQTNSFLESENAIFMQMAAQGQSMYAASGDSGAYDNGSSLTVDDPGSQPYVVAVGGTTLSVNGGGNYQSESSWKGGGGISKVWSQPAWQSGYATPQNYASSTMRNVPDVSLNSDPSTGYSIYVFGSWYKYGGTSCAAPLWAAFTALVNQQRATNSLAPLGFPSPQFYSIGAGNHYATDFHDIADGSTNLYYPAVTGYDDATGWGSFNGQGLFNDLITDIPYVPTAGGC